MSSWRGLERQDRFQRLLDAVCDVVGRAARLCGSSDQVRPSVVVEVVWRWHVGRSVGVEDDDVAGRQRDRDRMDVDVVERPSSVPGSTERGRPVGPMWMGRGGPRTRP